MPEALPPDSERIVFVDGYAQVYRAFYAIRGLTNSQGVPTNAVLGIARFLTVLDRELPHRYGAVVFDLGRPEARLEVLPEYKATRPHMPEEMRAQLPAIREWIQAAGWTILEEDGWEADDILAGAARAFRGKRITYIVSRDKDLAQLVSPETFLVIPAAKAKLDILGPEEVAAKFGVRPEQIPDYLALVGDSSDNIPGVPGVGAKTAAALLERFGSIDNLMAHLDEIPQKKMREKLAAAGELLERNRRIVTLEGKLPPSWPGEQALVRRPVQWDRLLALCRSLELKSLARELSKLRDSERNPALF